MNVIFSHGKESGPRGLKIRQLEAIAIAKGCKTHSIDYTDTHDPDARVVRLVDYLKQEGRPCILVGSSMGGYVTLMAAGQVEASALFLMAPALYMRGYKEDYPTDLKHVEIVHGWSDDVIPAENSIRYAKDADCTLHLIRGDHPLNDSIKVVEGLFKGFLEKVLA